jgi:hypothetical protein
MNGIAYVFVIEVNRIKFRDRIQHTTNLMNVGHSRFKHTGKRHDYAVKSTFHPKQRLQLQSQIGCKIPQSPLLIHAHKRCSQPQSRLRAEIFLQQWNLRAPKQVLKQSLFSVLRFYSSSGALGDWVLAGLQVAAIGSIVGC